MTNNVKAILESINKLSQLLMAQLDVRIENTERDNSQQTLTVASSTNDTEQYSDQQLAKLVTERHALISQLFNTYTQEQLSVELPLINELVSLDNQLTSKSQHNKQTLAAKILKLKKSKKVSKLYQKY
ncbi:MAG: hypothetical protein HRT55_10720 [Colwellia sp.]|uniref:hypothetical protein n=1 Tax=Colwellia sp. TaxID=56799 RepID=UPI0025C29DA1|nr:hypothetical protein [Colwellia sp.]NQZ26777.1 hypothetical protein [Colwellia sp.]